MTGAGLHGEALRVVRAGLPGVRQLPRGSMEVVLTALTRTRNGTPAERAIRAAAIAGCLVHTGSPDAALAIADGQATELLRAAASSQPPELQSAGYSLLAEVHLVNGRCIPSSDAARLAEEYARESGDEATIFRALSMRAVSAAQNGELSSAERWVQAANELGGPHGWLADSWPLALSGVHLGYRGGDVERISAALQVLHARSGDSPVWEAVYRLSVATEYAARGDFEGVVREAGELVDGATSLRSTRYLDDWAVFLKALTLIDLGRVSEAMGLVGDRESLPGHPVCFDLMRSGVHLRLGQPRKALLATEGCIDGSPHSLKNLPSVFLRRAIAYEQLGYTSLADANFSKSAHLAAGLGAVHQGVGVPSAEVETLFNRMLARERGFASGIAEILELEGPILEPTPLGVQPAQLTDREEVLADWLPTALTVGEISVRLGVSVNTVKSQLKSIYRKIGATSREDAVSRLHRGGFFIGRESTLRALSGASSDGGLGRTRPGAYEYP